jgi:hypothetical protein
MTVAEYTDLRRRWRRERLTPGPGQFLCEMCGGVFDSDADDDTRARAEAKANGLDPADCGVVCDDCFRLTPWGKGN